MESHQQDALLGEKIDNLDRRFDTLEARLNPIIEAYDSVLFGKKFVVGLATVTGAIAVIGGVVIAAINYIRHG